MRCPNKTLLLVRKPSLLYRPLHYTLHITQPNKPLNSTEHIRLGCTKLVCAHTLDYETTGNKTSARIAYFTPWRTGNA